MALRLPWEGFLFTSTIEILRNIIKCEDMCYIPWTKFKTAGDDDDELQISAAIITSPISQWYLMFLIGFRHHRWFRHYLTSPKMKCEFGTVKISSWWNIWIQKPSHLLDLNHWYRICQNTEPHDDVIEWKHFPRYWPFVRGIHRSPVNSPHKGQWRGALMFSLIGAN